MSSTPATDNRPVSYNLRDWALIAATSGVTTLNIFANGAITIALPTIGKDLNFKQADLQWPISAYALSYGCLLLFFGRVGDIVGGRIMFVLGTIWFSIWSLASAFAPNEVTFIVFVALQGLGAAANTPAGIRILTSHFEPGTRRNTAFGILGAGQPVGYIVGLVAGGLLTDSKATWRTLLYLQAGLGVAFVLAGWVALRSDSNGGDTKRYTKGLDWGGAILSTVGIALLTFSLADSTSASRGWATPEIPSLLSVSVIFLAAFLWYEQRREKNGQSVLMPLSMWNQPGAKMGSMVFIAFFAWFGFNTMGYLMTLYFQEVLLLSPLRTAIDFIPMTIAGFMVNLVTGHLMGRVKGQYLCWVGLVACLASPIIFALMETTWSYWYSAFLVLILIVGADAIYPVGNLQVCSAFDADSQAIAGGLFSVATRLGTSLGLAITSSISTSTSSQYLKHHPYSAADPSVRLTSTSPEVLMAGYRAAGWTCAASIGLSLIAAVWRLRDLGIVGLSSSQKLTEKPPSQSLASESKTRLGNNIELVAISEVGTTLQDVEGPTAV